jgi:CxxC motif-containing protein (DUF1111 family)
VDGVLPEVRVQIERSPGPDRGLPGVVLQAPLYALHELAYGPLGDGAVVSPRLGPHLIGLGLLEAIPEDRLRELADPDDLDGDGVSGRLQRHGDGRVGRFGWKGDAATVEDQVAGAFVGDMGLTSALHPTDDCTAAQPACGASPSGGDPEVEPQIFDRVLLYSRALAPPVRREADHPEVLAGQGLFTELGCAGCHVPAHRTGPGALRAVEGQHIFPYTDLLLHDMGPELADGRAVGAADGQEWRTPPLWGLGLQDDVTGEAHFLHDGRARTLTEAVLWHGGEAEAAREAFRTAGATDRAALLAFLRSL